MEKNSRDVIAFIFNRPGESIKKKILSLGKQMFKLESWHWKADSYQN